MIGIQTVVVYAAADDPHLGLLLKMVLQSSRFFRRVEVMTVHSGHANKVRGRPPLPR